MSHLMKEGVDTYGFLRPESLQSERVKLQLVRRRGMPHFALHRRNFLPLFYGVSEIFLGPRKIPL